MSARYKPDPGQAFQEFTDLNAKLLRGMDLLNKIRDEDVKIATTPKHEVWRQDKTTLYRYEATAPRKIGTPVLMVYGLVGRYTMEINYYTTASRYTTSAFLRLKLGESLARRRVAPHIFESAAEAEAFVAKSGNTETSNAA